MSRPYDLLIFDWDGTLVDSVGWIVSCLREAAADVGLPVPPEGAARSVIGLSLADALRRLFPSATEQDQKALVTAYRDRFLARPATPHDMFDGAVDTLKILRERGYRLAVATGKARVGLDRALEGTGTASLFAMTRCADEAASKPDPTMVRQILAALRVPPTRALMIGDTVHDLSMATHAGVGAVGVTSGADSAESLEALRPLACLADVTELPGLLEMTTSTIGMQGDMQR